MAMLKINVTNEIVMEVAQGLIDELQLESLESVRINIVDGKTLITIIPENRDKGKNAEVIKTGDEIKVTLG